MRKYAICVFCASVFAAQVLTGCVSGGGGGGGGDGWQPPPVDAGSDAPSDAPSGWYADAGQSGVIPVIPSTCSVSMAYPECGINHTTYVCGDAKPDNCTAFTPKDYNGPPLFCCANSLCAQNCGDAPCPGLPCPSNAQLWTCGPDLPDIAPGCTLLMKQSTPAGDRYNYCCNYAGQ